MNNWGKKGRNGWNYGEFQIEQESIFKHHKDILEKCLKLTHWMGSIAGYTEQGRISKLKD